MGRYLLETVFHDGRLYDAGTPESEALRGIPDGVWSDGEPLPDGPSTARVEALLERFAADDTDEEAVLAVLEALYGALERLGFDEGAVIAVLEGAGVPSEPETPGPASEPQPVAEPEPEPQPVAEPEPESAEKPAASRGRRRN